MATAEAPQKEAPPAARPRQLLALILIAGVVGLVVSLAAWGFLQLAHYLQVWLYDDLAEVFGYDHGAPPEWWPLPLCAIAGLVTAIAIVRLPGRGGHVPAHGLNAAATEPIELPGVLLAAFATLGLGIVLGPEAPLIASGGGLGILTIRMARRGATDDVVTLMAASGAFAAISFIFESPLIAAMILIEATGLGGSRLPLVLVPGLFASQSARCSRSAWVTGPAWMRATMRSARWT
jgi:H+/Cl- antiporter ClcA